MKSQELTNKTRIAESLAALASGPLPAGAIRLLGALGYESRKTVQLELNTSEGLLEVAGQDDFLNPQKAHRDEWKSVDFLFQFTDEEVRNTGQNTFDFDSSADLKSDRLIESYLFLAIELKGESYSRTVLADITREVNRLFPMPVLIVFRHGETITLSVIDRRLHKRDQSRDVLLKVALIKDIAFRNPIRAHIDILYDLSLKVLQEEFQFHNFVGLHLALKKRLDADTLNRRFYSDLARWYFWALRHEGLIPPRDVKTEEERSIFLIRLLTRLIFCWFLQEKGLIPRDVFRQRLAEQMITDASPSSGSYYRAFLQNLFFAALNQEPNKRAFSHNGTRAATNLYRYADLLKDPDAFEQLMHDVPFVNGGLFDCLDRIDDGNNVILDDFSEDRESAINVPNEIFFGEDREVDLTDVYGDARHRHERTRGLINLLSRYKFTVEESTPLEQEIALDPELLGRVFENLLASYNEDTRTTARNATGSFYTPREIVRYMVDESLVGYLQTVLTDSNSDASNVSERLRQLFVSGPVNEANFSDQEAAALVAAIDRVKILDPACGSGAFLMGALQRLVDLLQKLDPTNEHWRALQRARAVAETDLTFRRGDKEERKQRLNDINEVFERNTSDYGRKLYLIENCIYGVDIQPIGCQIAKLRFFISLIVDQNVDRAAINFGVRPLPNLEAKVVAADALVPIERPREHQFDLFHAQLAPLRHELREVRHKYFFARTHATKTKCRQRDAELRKEIAALLRESGWSSRAARKMADWDPYDQNTHATFFDLEWMFGAEVESGLDIVIGNPPYIRLQTLKQKDPEQVEFLKDHFESARKGNYDVYVVFVERGLQLLKPAGNLAYILPHKFFNAQYGEPLRALISRGKYLRHIVHFGDQQVFPGATNYVCLMFLNKLGTESLRFVKVDDLEDWLKNKTATEANIPEEKIGSTEWNFAVGQEGEIFDRLNAASSKLGDVADIFVGLQTSADDVFILKYVKETEDELILESKSLGVSVVLEKALLHPVVSGVDVKAWLPLPNRQYILFPYDVVNETADLIPFTALQHSYPKTADYLRRNKQRLEDRESGRFRDEDWHRFGRSQNLGIQQRSKICVPRLVDKLHAAADIEGLYYLDNVDVGGVTWKPQFGRNDLLFLLALFNSSLWQWYFPHVSAPFRGGFRSANRQYLAQLPVPKATAEQQLMIKTVAEYILWIRNQKNLKNEDLNSSRTSLMVGYFEQVINGLVYELFFAEELHLAGLRPFELVEKARLARLDEVPESKRIATLRETFEQLYNSKHPLRGCLHDLGSLETVRIIEGRQ